MNYPTIEAGTTFQIPEALLVKNKHTMCESIDANTTLTYLGVSYLGERSAETSGLYPLQANQKVLWVTPELILMLAGFETAILN